MGIILVLLPFSGNPHAGTYRWLNIGFSLSIQPSEFAKVAIKHWNNNSLDENELIEKVEYVYNRGYKYGCRDVIMSKYCQTRCIYYQRKDYTIDVMSSDELQADLHNRLTTDFSGRCIPLADMLGLEYNLSLIHISEPTRPY